MTDDSYNSYEEPKVCNHYNYKLEGDEWTLREDSFRDKNLITTPGWIVKDILDLLPDSVWNTETTFLIPCIKSGNFAIEVKNRLMKCQDALEKFPDYDDRRNHIDSKQLFCIYWYTEEEFNKNLISGHIWGITGFLEALYSPSINFMCTDDLNFDTFKDKTGKKQEKLLESIKEKFGTVKFDVVIGNPPYNNDLYIDFVEWGHQRASKYSLWITPAKWQAKGGDKNERFRQQIVPHMSKIVYYIDSTDIFDITSHGGITYYLVDNSVNTSKLLHVMPGSKLNYMCDETIIKDDSRLTWFDTKINTIVTKVYSKNHLKFETVKASQGMFNVKITNVLSDKAATMAYGGYVLISPYIDRNELNKNIHTSCIRVCKTENEALSYISYINTRFVRWLVSLSAFTVSIMNDETWRFVPDPGAFDHIFTDKELYDKYGLTQDEIDLIESVIKERK